MAKWGGGRGHDRREKGTAEEEKRNTNLISFRNLRSDRESGGEEEEKAGGGMLPFITPFIHPLLYSVILLFFFIFYYVYPLSVIISNILFMIIS